MILEITQMLWTAWWLTSDDFIDQLENIPITPYKPTHINHPTCIWVRIHRPNFDFALRLALELCKEYTFRYNKQHACQSHILWLRSHPPPCNSSDSYRLDQVFATSTLPRNCTYVPLAMPTCFHSPSLVKSYRNYYRSDKAVFSSWKNRPIPSWF